MKILPSFTHTHIIPNLYDSFSVVEHTRKYFKKVGNQF